MLFAGLILLACAVLVTAELWGRRVKKWKTELEPRPFHPFFVSGDFIGDDCSGKEFFFGKNGPIASGSDFVAGALINRYEKFSVSARSSSSFLFDHYLSRYSADQVDAITFSDPKAVRIFVIGNSAAQGAGATSKETTWHCQLEQMLRRRFSNYAIYVFNAAMGGFVTTQERIAFDLAIAPRRPDVVIALNGYTDVSVPLERCVMPGDTRFTGKRYAQIYDRSLMHFLRAHSVIVDRISRQKIRRVLQQRRAEVIGSQEKRIHLKNTIGSVYLENVRYMFQRCQDMGIPCLTFLQPWRNLAVPSEWKLTPESYHFQIEVYQKISDTMTADTTEYGLRDISKAFDEPSLYDTLIDFCHFSDEGQQQLAALICPDAMDAVAEALKNAERRETVDVVYRHERFEK